MDVVRAQCPTLRLQFEDGIGKVGMHFEPVQEAGWHHYSFRLDEFYFIDGSTDFNPYAVTVFQVMAEDMASQEVQSILMKCFRGDRR